MVPGNGMPTRAGLARAVAAKRTELWLKDNQEAIESPNTFVEQHGLPLDVAPKAVKALNP